MSNTVTPPVSTLSDIEAIESVPLTEALPFRTTWDILSHSGDKYRDAIALSFIMSGDPEEDPTNWTYDQLLRNVRATANTLHEIGVTKTSPASIILPNLPEYHFSLWGAQCAGVANPINPMLDSSHIAGIIQAAQSKVVVTVAQLPGADVHDKVVDAIQQCPTVEHLILVDPAIYLPQEVAQQIAASRVPIAFAENGPTVHKFEEIVNPDAGVQLVFEPEIEPQDTASLFHTGGTTGIPKLARHSHLNEAFESWVINRIRGGGPGQVILCGLPLFHVNGAIVTGLAAFAAGARVVLASPQGYRTPGILGNFWKHVEKYKINTFSCVPTILSTLIEQPINADVSSLEYAICGAAPMSPTVFSQFEEATGVKILEGYGLTEGTCVSSLNPVGGKRKVGSVGLRLPYQELRIAEMSSDGQVQRFCGTDEPGEIVVRGPNVFPGYTDTSKNHGVLLDDGWMVTGDIGRLDEEGYLWLTGREKDLIIRGGHNIDPALIENALMKHDEVALAAAIGQIDSYAGEIPVAFVTVKEGSSVTVDELADFARENISERAAVPCRIEIIEEMPVTTVGKTFKPTLRERAAKFVLESTLADNSIKLASLKTLHDPTTGLTAEVELSEGMGLEQVSTLVGQYAIHLREV